MRRHCMVETGRCALQSIELCACIRAGVYVVTLSVDDLLGACLLYSTFPAVKASMCVYVRMRESAQRKKHWCVKREDKQKMKHAPRPSPPTATVSLPSLPTVAKTHLCLFERTCMYEDVEIFVNKNNTFFVAGAKT